MAESVWSNALAGGETPIAGSRRSAGQLVAISRRDAPEVCR